jgi:hypothetical protein
MLKPKFTERSFSFFVFALSFATLFVCGTARAASNFRVGLAAVDITPVVGVPLAGYGGADRRMTHEERELPRSTHPYTTYLKASVGVRDPIWARAMVVEGNDSYGKPVKAAFLSLDLVGISHDLRSDILAQVKDLDLDGDYVVVAATHTHSGPGALVKNPFWEHFAADRYQKSVYGDLVSRASKALRLAVANLREADLFSTSFMTEGLQNNRRHEPGHFDPQARLLLAQDRESGAWLGGLVNYAIHGTALGPKNLLFSADLPGALERKLEEQSRRKNASKGVKAPMGNPVFVFLNGAEGDVVPVNDGHADIDELASKFEIQSRPAWARLVPVQGSIRAERNTVKLGHARWNFSACNAEGYEGGFFVKLFFHMIGLWFPKKVAITRLELGPLAFLTWPGEPTTSVGEELLRRQKGSGYESWIVALAQDHLGYFTTPQEHDVGGYEACVNFYGRESSLELWDAHDELRRELDAE